MTQNSKYFRVTVYWIMHVRVLAYRRNNLRALTHKAIECGMQSDSEVCCTRASTVGTGLTNYITNSVIAFSGLQLYSSLRVVHSVCPKLGPFFSSSWTTCLSFLNYLSSYTTLLRDTDFNKVSDCVFLRSWELFWIHMSNQKDAKSLHFPNSSLRSQMFDDCGMTMSNLPIFQRKLLPASSGMEHSFLIEHEGSQFFRNIFTYETKRRYMSEDWNINRKSHLGSWKPRKMHENECWMSDGHNQ